jgi:hypothetical protein
MHNSHVLANRIVVPGLTPGMIGLATGLDFLDGIDTYCTMASVNAVVIASASFNTVVAMDIAFCDENPTATSTSISDWTRSVSESAFTHK